MNDQVTKTLRITSIRKLLRKEGIHYTHDMTKDELIDLLENKDLADLSTEDNLDIYNPAKCTAKKCEYSKKQLIEFIKSRENKKNLNKKTKEELRKILKFSAFPRSGNLKKSCKEKKSGESNKVKIIRKTRGDKREDVIEKAIEILKESLGS